MNLTERIFASPPPHTENNRGLDRSISLEQQKFRETSLKLSTNITHNKAMSNMFANTITT
jgi:hypothetical protein